MAYAFASFDEPHAWLIRGLVDYGWLDSSRTGGHIPAGRFGGINLARISEDEGRSGIVLEVPALSGGRFCPEDGVYAFQLQVQRGADGAYSAVVRCPVANYFQEFPYDPANPQWAAGYIHQALTEYVPKFVDWRLGGGEVSWSQRAGIPEVEGEPCTFLLASFLRERVTSNRPMHLGPGEGWWMGKPTPAAWTGPIAVAGKGSDPVYVANAAKVVGAPAAVAIQVENVQARALTKGPGTALLVVTGLGMAEGLLLLVNAMSVVLWYRDSIFALLVSLFGAVYLLVGGFASVFGALRYRSAGKGVLPWLSMVYVALAPFCCIGGVPVAIWAYLTWNKPMVRAARQ